MFKLIPISTDLRSFNEIIGRDAINEIDRKHNLPLLSKFAEAVGESLSDYCGWRHTYQSIWIEIPMISYVEISGCPNLPGFRITVEPEGLMVKGIMTGPLDLWREFIVWAGRSDRSEFVNNIGKALLNHFRQYHLFRDVLMIKG